MTTYLVDALDDPGMDGRMSLSALHEICGSIRSSTWAGIDEDKAFCLRCPKRDVTAYGAGIRGCMLLACEVYQIAARDAHQTFSPHEGK